MKKIKVRCWKGQTQCPSGALVVVYYTVPDFGDCFKLFTCLKCGTVLAVDPENEFYSKIPFEQLREKIHCPVCNTSLATLTPYPDSFVCITCKVVGHFEKSDRTIPPDDQSVVMEFWNPYAA